MKFANSKEVFSRLGFLFSPRAIHYANGILNYLNIGRWFHDRKLSVPTRCSDRPALHQHVATLVTEPVTYVEFGVFKGESLRRWSGLLKHPDSQLHGFDSFEGLPETWNIFMSKEILDVGGALPEIRDGRVQLFKGWFSETVPAYAADLKPHANLVLHLDADIYSSTIYVLRQMRPFLKPGTILVFDEFFDREHELKAFTEFLEECPLTFECIGATRALTQVAFRILSVPPSAKQV